MNTILKDYIAYYKLRMDRYEGDKMFAYSYQSEKALYDLVSSVKNMEELQQKTQEMGKLAVENGIAFTKDEATCKLQFYKKEKEDIYAKGQQELLDKVTAAKDAYSIAAISSEVLAKNNTEITVDTLWPMEFFNKIGLLEKIEICQKAIVPNEWKPEMEKLEKEHIQFLQDQTKLFLQTIRNYKPDWKLDYNILWEHRHRKKIPLLDNILKQRITKHREYCKAFL